MTELHFEVERLTPSGRNHDFNIDTVDGIQALTLQTDCYSRLVQ